MWAAIKNCFLKPLSLITVCYKLIATQYQMVVNQVKCSRNMQENYYIWQQVDLWRVFLRQPFSLNSENKYYWLWRFLANHLSAISFSVLFSSVTQSCLTLCDPMDCSTPGLPVHHQLPEFTQTHVHWVGDAIQLSHPLLSPSPPAFNLSQHQGLFKWVSSSHQVAKILEFQLQHQSFQWTFRTDSL